MARTGFLPLSAENNVQIIAACPIAKIFYGCELTSVTDDSLTKMRTQVIRAIWKGRSSRIPEVVMSLIHPGHRCDPVQVVAYRAWVTLRNMCLKYPQLATFAASIWSSHLELPHNTIWGPIHSAFRAVAKIGWTWNRNFEQFQKPCGQFVDWLGGFSL